MSFATILLYYLPKPALSLIIASAVFNLIDVREMRFLKRAHARDLWIVAVLVRTI